MASYTYLVSDIRKISPTAIRVRLQRPTKSSAITNFQAGQYVGISFMRFGRPTPMRFFSITNTPNNAGILEFGIRVGGAYTLALLDLEQNDEVKVIGPFGNFTYDHLKGNQAILIAGGIGITPILSLIRMATQNKLRSKIILLYANNSQDDIPFSNELLHLERLNPFFKTYFIVSSGKIDKLPENHALIGRITQKTLETVSDNLWQGFTYFICGPQGFMNTMSNTLKGMSVDENNIITESFNVTRTSSQTVVPNLIYKASFALVALLAAIIGLKDISKYLPVSADNNTTSQSTNNNVVTPSNNGSADSSTLNTMPSVQQTPITSYQAPVSRVS